LYYLKRIVGRGDAMVGAIYMTIRDPASRETQTD